MEFQRKNIETSLMNPIPGKSERYTYIWNKQNFFRLCGLWLSAVSCV